MSMLLRNFFYSLGLVALLSCWSMNPDAAQLKDVLVLLHSATFWQRVGAVSAVLVSLEMAWAGGYGGPAETIFYGAPGAKEGRMAVNSLAQIARDDLDSREAKS